MEKRNIKVTNLFIDLDNFRFEHQTSQVEAINKMVEENKDNLYNLAIDILTNGLNPTDIPLVVKLPTDDNKFIVMEGNRRITTLKILLNPNLIDNKHQSLKKKFIKLVSENESKVIWSLECGICANREEAYLWIERKHSNGLHGIGTQQWNAIQKQRFEEATKGKTSMALQVINMLMKADTVEDSFKEQLKTVKVTNLQRLISDPDVRTFLGISLKNGRLTSDIKKEVVTDALTEILKDMMKEDFKVSKIYKKGDRATYMRNMFGTSTSLNSVTNKTERWDFVTTQAAQREVDDKQQKMVIAQPMKPRVTLIPKKYELPITDGRVASIFHELKGLIVKNYVNTTAIMFRIFLEMSVDVYIETFHLLKAGKLTSSKSGKNLLEKLQTVIEHLKTIKAANIDMTKGMEFAMSNKNSPLSPETLNSYVHNYRFSPMPDTLISEWDNVQPFFECLWSAVAKQKGNEQ